MIKCSLGVIVFNEEANIANLLDALLVQKMVRSEISEIIVVSSACTDKTDKIVASYADKHPHIILIIQAERAGKSAAINLFLAAAKYDIAIIESGDTLPAIDTVEKMLCAFDDPAVGMVGGRPSPENDTNTFIGYAVHLLWRLHHRMALISPKLGEMIAFRKCFDAIPPESAVDEASIEAIIKQAGYTKRYLPDAIIHNKGPENFRDFVLQRRRIAAGHYWLADTQKYQVTSAKPGIMLSITWQEICAKPLSFGKIVMVMCLEIYCRCLGHYDYKHKNKNPFAWEIAQSTKNLKTRIK